MSSRSSGTAFGGTGFVAAAGCGWESINPYSQTGTVLWDGGS